MIGNQVANAKRSLHDLYNMGPKVHPEAVLSYASHAQLDPAQPATAFPQAVAARLTAISIQERGPSIDLDQHCRSPMVPDSGTEACNHRKSLLTREPPHNFLPMLQHMHEQRGVHSLHDLQKLTIYNRDCKSRAAVVRHQAAWKPAYGCLQHACLPHVPDPQTIPGFCIAIPAGEGQTPSLKL